MATQEDYEEAVKRAESAMHDRERARAYFALMGDESVGSPAMACGCPMFNYLKTVCPYIDIESVTAYAYVKPKEGSMWDVGDRAVRITQGIAELHRQALGGPSWFSDFINRTDGTWGLFFNDARPITGTIAIGILDRCGTAESEIPHFLAQVRILGRHEQWRKLSDRLAPDLQEGSGW